MGELRTKMDNDMILRGLSARTRKSYLTAVRGIAKHYQKTPDSLSDEQVQAYLLYLYRDRKLAWNSCSIAVHGLRFFYHATLGRDVTSFVIPKVGKKEERIPDILSQEEVARLLSSVQNRKHRALLMTTYAAGLRASEVTQLRVADIDSQRSTIRIEQGKGSRDRYVPLSARLLVELRSYWREYHPQHWLFAAQHTGEPLSVCTAQRAYARAKERARITKNGGIHALRHAFATHMIEAGVDIHAVQQLLGHRSLTATARYLHVTQKRLVRSSPLDLLRLPDATRR